MKNNAIKHKLTIATLTVACLTLSLSACTTKSSDNNSKKQEDTVNAKDTEGYKTTKADVEIIRTYASQLLTDPQNNPVDLSKGGFIWDSEKKSDSWRYFDGVMIESFLMLGDEKATTYAEKFYTDNIKEDGTIPSYKDGELDSVMTALGMFDLLGGNNQKRYQEAIQNIYQKLHQQTSYPECGGNYLHKDSWTKFQIGLDGLYMAQPFLMRCANAIEKGNLNLTDADGNQVSADAIYDQVFKRMNWVADTMYDETTKLYHHGWNVENKCGNGHFWGRGIGWYAMALVDVIDDMPKGKNKDQLILKLPKLFDGMLSYQDQQTGMWYNVVNQPDLEKNKLETSVSAMMSYALLKAYNKSWVSDNKYKDAGLNAFHGIVKTKVVKEGDKTSVLDIYQKSGVETDDTAYVNNNYVADEGKGTGALIMAASQALKAAEH